MCCCCLQNYHLHHPTAFIDAAKCPLPAIILNFQISRIIIPQVVEVCTNKVRKIVVENPHQIADLNVGNLFSIKVMKHNQPVNNPPLTTIQINDD